MATRINRSRLRSERESLGLSQEQLAGLAKVTKNTVERMENREKYNTTLDTIGKVANALGLRASDLILED